MKLYFIHSLPNYPKTKQLPYFVFKMAVNFQLITLSFYKTTKNELKKKHLADVYISFWALPALKRV